MRDNLEPGIIESSFIENHPLGHMTVGELRRKALKDSICVYGDKVQILRCFNIARNIRNYGRDKHGE